MNNPQAFPAMEYETTAGRRYHYGMKLRDYFAAAALTGYLTSGLDDALTNPGKVAEWAYKNADAMLKAREVKP